MIVAISGWKGSGKDTAAKILVEKYGFRRLAFADVLKDMVAEQYGITRSHCDDPEYKEKPILTMPATPKDAFAEMIQKFLYKELRTESGEQPIVIEIKDGQSYGTPYGQVSLQKLYWTPRALCILEGSVKRSVNSGYWTDRALKSIKPNEDVVISDMRFRNEAKKVKDAGSGLEMDCVTVRINRFDSSPSVDPSEHDLDDHGFDRTLENKASLSDLEYKLALLLDEYELNRTVARNVSWSE